MKRFLILIPILAVLAALYWWQSRPATTGTWQGYAEADYLRIAPTLAGKLTTLAVARGDTVQAGAPLFTQDAIDDQAARDQAAAALQQSQAQLKNLQAAAKTTEINAAQADVADAAATLDRARRDLARVAALVPTGAATRKELDLMAQSAHSAEAHLAAATARRDQAQAPTGRAQEIAGATMAVAAAQAALAQADWRLAQRTIQAPHAARITDVYARPGETLAAGAPAVELLPPENILVRFFVPDSELGRIRAGDPVTIACDGCPAAIPAHITFIAPQAEYTPPVIYSNETRAKLVFLVEAHPSPADAVKLNPGQPVTVHPAATP